MRYRHRRTGKLVTVEPGSRHHAQLERHRAFEQVGAKPEPEPEPDEESETEPDDGIQHVGGGLFEVTHDGQTERVRGKEAAEARLAELADDGGW